jgi:hypothetical protein
MDSNYTEPYSYDVSSKPRNLYFSSRSSVLVSLPNNMKVAQSKITYKNILLKVMKYIIQYWYTVVMILSN